MANWQLIRGARDVGRAKIYDPVRFQGWIRSMFRGLDRMDERYWRNSLYHRSAAQKAMKDRMETQSKSNSEFRKLMNNVKLVNPGKLGDSHIANLKDFQFFTNNNQNLYTAAQNKSLSSDFQVMSEMDAMTENIQGSVKWLGNTFATEYSSWSNEMKPILMKNALPREYENIEALYHFMSNENIHNIIPINDFGEYSETPSDIFFEFNTDVITNDPNLKELIETYMMPTAKHPITGQSVHGLSWSIFKNNYANFNLNREDLFGKINEVVEQVHNGARDGDLQGLMYDKQKDGSLKPVDKEEYIRRLISSNIDEYNVINAIGKFTTKGEYATEDPYLNFLSAAVNWGAGSGDVFAESDLAQSIQVMYEQWYDSLSDEEKKRKENMGGLLMPTAKPIWDADTTYWVFDRDFAVGEVDNLPGWSDTDWGENFKAKDILKNALAHHIFANQYDAIKSYADEHITDHNAKLLEGQTGSGGSLKAADFTYLRTFEDTVDFINNRKEGFRVGGGDLDEQSSWKTNMKDFLQRQISGTVETVNEAYDKYEKSLKPAYDAFTKMDDAGKTTYLADNPEPTKPMTKKEFMQKYAIQDSDPLVVADYSSGATPTKFTGVSMDILTSGDPQVIVDEIMRLSKPGTRGANISAIEQSQEFIDALKKLNK